MGRSRKGYSSYRGRRTATDILKWIAIVLGVLVAVLLGVLFFGQDYLVFTDLGSEWRSPFAQAQQPQQPETPGDVSVIIQPPAGSQDAAGEEEASREEERMTALELPLSAVLEGTVQAALEEAGANALILEMKDQEGQLGWASQVPLAVQTGVSSQVSGVNEALEAWNRGEVYTVARVCCFRDNTVPYQRNGMALRASYGNWRDELGLRWLNPDSQQARDYLAGLCGELAQLGFDEILLECCAFPTQGSLGAILQEGSYADGQFEGVVRAFLEQVRQAVEPYGATLSVAAARGAVSEGGDGSGLTAAVLEGCAGRIWMEQDGLEPPLSALLEAAGVTQVPARLVEEASDGADGLRAEGLLP